MQRELSTKYSPSGKSAKKKKRMNFQEIVRVGDDRHGLW